MLISDVREKKVFNFFSRADKECLLDVATLLSQFLPGETLGFKFYQHIDESVVLITVSSQRRERQNQMNVNTLASKNDCSYAYRPHKKQEMFISWKVFCL
jgi:hypothetical protein